MNGSAQHSERKEEEQVWGEDDVSRVSHVENEVYFIQPGGKRTESRWIYRCREKSG